MVRNLIDEFSKLDLTYIARIDNVEKLSVQVAQYKLSLLSKNLKSFEKLDRLIPDTQNNALISSFDSFKKSVYKYEAKLRKVANSDTAIIETPNDIKLGIYNRTKKTLRLS